MTTWEEVEEKSNMDVVSEDTKVTFYADDSRQEDEEGNMEIVATFDAFTVTSQMKRVLLEEISMADATGLEKPYIILLPSSDLDKVPKNFTYPFVFKDQKVFVVPYIKGILVYENE